MPEIGKKAVDVIKAAVADGIVMPDETTAISTALIADDGKVDARGARLLFHHIHDVHSKAVFVLEEDRSRLGDIAKLGIKQLFDHRHNKLFGKNPKSKQLHVRNGASLLFDSIGTDGSRTSFSYFDHELQTYRQITLDSRRREYMYAGLCLKSGSVGRGPVLVKDMRWYVDGLLPPLKMDIANDATRREKLVVLADAVEKGIYTENRIRKIQAKLKGYSKESKQDDQTRVANKYFQSIAKRKPHTVFKVRGVTIKVRGEIAPGIKEKLRQAFEEFHANELKALGSLHFNIYDEHKLKRFVKSNIGRKARYAYSSSGAFVERGKQPAVFINTYCYKEIVTLRHELGHALDIMLGGNRDISLSDFWGIAQHYRSHVQPCKDRACLVDRAVNLYAGDAQRVYPGIDPEPEWFSESRRLMMSNEGYVGPDGYVFSTLAEFKRKDPVGFLVFTKYRQLLDENNKRPQDAFSMTSFHEARTLVASSRGKITETLLKKWSKLKLDLKAERHVQHGIALVKKGKQNCQAAILAFRKALALMPEYSYACAQLAATLELVGNKEESIREYQKLFDRDPLAKDGGVPNLINYYKEHRKDEKLRALYDKLTVLHPKNAKYHIAKSALMAKNGKAEQAYGYLEKQARRTGKLDYLFAVARIANRRRDFSKVRRLFDTLRKQEGRLTQNCAAGYNYIGNLLYDLEVRSRYQETLWWYEQGLKKYPDDLELNYNYIWTAALDLKMKGVNDSLFKRAVAHLERREPMDLLKEAKAGGMHLPFFATKCIEGKRYKLAIIVLGKLLQIRPNDISLRINYAKALHGAGRKQEFDKELTYISSNHVKADDRLLWLVELVRSVAKRGDDARAIQLLDRLVAIDKGWGAVEYAAYYLSRKKEKNALKHLEELRIAIANGKYEPSPNVYSRAGDVLYDAKRYALALPWYDAGIRQSPRDFELNYSYAWTALIHHPKAALDIDLLNQAMGYLTTLDAETSLKHRKQLDDFTQSLAGEGLKDHVWALCDNMQPRRRLAFIKKVLDNLCWNHTRETMYRVWLKYEPNSVAAHVGLAKSLAVSGKHRDALRILDVWGEDYVLHPDISIAKARLASRKKLSAHHQRAIAELQEMEASRPDITLTPDHYRQVADSFKAMGDKVNAMAWLVHATKRYPKNYKLHWQSAELAIELEDEEWLQEEIDILNELDPARYVVAEVAVAWSSDDIKMVRVLTSVDIHANSN